MIMNLSSAVNGNERRWLPVAVETTPVAQLVSTYAVTLVLIFFVMGGYLPTSGTRLSSLQTVSSATDTFAGELFLLGVWALALLMMWPWFRSILATCLQMKAMLCLPVLAILSVIWSQDLGNSARKGIFLLLGTLFAFYLAGRFSAVDLAQIFVMTGLCAGVLGIVFSVLLPQYGRDTFNDNAWQGIFRSKNGCAQIMLFLLSPAVAFSFPNRTMEMMRVSLFPVAGLLLVMSMAKTSWLLAPVFLLFMGALSALKKFHRRDVLFVFVAGISLLAVAGFALSYVIPLVLSSLGKDASVSGRLPLWASAMVSIMKRPLLGYGYAAFWTGLKGESLNIFMSTHFEIYQAQNGLLEVALELGLAGVILVLLTLANAVKDALTCIQHGHSQAVNWYIGLIVLTVIYNVDESFLATAHSIPWLMYIVACTGLSSEANRLKSSVLRGNKQDIRRPGILSAVQVSIGEIRTELRGAAE
jgi:exopolysaccharide production protein ExoQ